MIALLDLFAGLKTRLLVGAGIALAILAVLARVFSAGKQSERAAAATRNATAVKEAKHVANEIHALDRADVDARRARWMRDGER